jgi:hypothetical protein
MNPRKSIDDLSRSYIKRQGKRLFSWSKLWAQKVTEVNGAKLTMSAKLAYFLLQPILNENSGYLNEDLRFVAAKLGMDEFRLADDIAKLVKVDALRKTEDGIVYDARMVEDSGEITQNYTKLHKITKDMSPNGDVCPREKENEVPLVEESRVEVSQSAPADLTYYCPSESQTETETDKNRLLPSPIFGLTETDLADVQKKFQNLDFDTVYQKFVGHHKKKGSEKVTKALLVGWFKREKPAKEKANATVNVKATHDDTNSETYFMRDMPRFYTEDLDAALNWFYARRKLNTDDPESMDLFDTTVEGAVKSGDVVTAESMQGECKVGLNRIPVMIQREEPQYNKGKGKNKEVVCYLEEIFIGEHKISRLDIAKIRAMPVIPEGKAVEFLKELLPDVETNTNWLAVLDEEWLFDKDAAGMYSGKSESDEKPELAPPSEEQLLWYEDYSKKCGRIQKLKNLAEDPAAFPNEAAIALYKAAIALDKLELT